MEFRYELADGIATVQIEPADSGYSITILRPNQAPRSLRVEARRPEHGRLTLCFGERRVRAYVAMAGRVRHVALGGHSWQLEPPRVVGRRAEAGGSLSAAMPGKVLDVLVAAGQKVEAGAPLVVLEAMKMELRITAPAAGVVERLHVEAGDVVEQGQKLVELA